MTTIDHQQAARSTYISPALPGMIRDLWKSDPSERSVQTALALAGDLIQELIDLRAATPHLRASVAEEVRALIADKPKNPHMYNPWEDSSVDPTNLDEVVGAAVSRGWGSGYYEGVQAVLALLEGGGESGRSVDRQLESEWQRGYSAGYRDSERGTICGRRQAANQCGKGDTE